MSAGTVSLEGFLRAESGYGSTDEGRGVVTLDQRGVTWAVQKRGLEGLLAKTHPLFAPWDSVLQAIVGREDLYLYFLRAYSPDGSALADSSGVAVELLSLSGARVQAATAALRSSLPAAGWTSGMWWGTAAAQRNSPLWCQEKGCEASVEVKPTGVAHDCFIYQVECWDGHSQRVRIPSVMSELAGMWASGEDPRWIDYRQVAASVEELGHERDIQWFGFLRDAGERTIATMSETRDDSAPAAQGLVAYRWSGTQLGVPEQVILGIAGPEGVVPEDARVEIRVGHRHPKNALYDPQTAPDFGHRLLTELNLRRVDPAAAPQIDFRTASVPLAVMLRGVRPQPAEVETVSWYYYKGPVIDLEARLLLNGEWCATRRLDGICLEKL